MKKTKDRYVLGCGYPKTDFLDGSIGLYVNKKDDDYMTLDIPDKIRSDSLVKYQLVLERVKTRRYKKT
jgi:hypothetical protein